MQINSWCGKSYDFEKYWDASDDQFSLQCADLVRRNIVKNNSPNIVKNNSPRKGCRYTRQHFDELRHPCLRAYLLDTDNPYPQSITYGPGALLVANIASQGISVFLAGMTCCATNANRERGFFLFFAILTDVSGGYFSQLNSLILAVAVARQFLSLDSQTRQLPADSVGHSSKQHSLWVCFAECRRVCGTFGGKFWQG